MKGNNDCIEKSHIRVAVVDDHRIVRLSLIPRLEAKGDIKVVISAANGKELAKALEKSKELPSVCLIDIEMPEMNGFETVAYIKRTWPDMKILVLTGYLREAYVIQMIYAGVNGYLSKDSHPKTVHEAICHVQEFDIYCNELFCIKDVKAIREGRKEFPKLTEKEIQLLRYCVQDLTYLEIAQLMNSTPKSIEGYRNKLFLKLGVKSRTGLAMFAVRYGYVTIEAGLPIQ